jgi:hypothetical protein
MELKVLVAKFNECGASAGDHAAACSHAGLFTALSSGRDERGEVRGDNFSSEVVGTAMVYLKEDSSRSIYDCLAKAYEFWSRQP